MAQVVANVIGLLSVVFLVGIIVCMIIIARSKFF
jgi:hypothetical protein